MCSAFYNICLGETLKNVHLIYHNDYLLHYLSNNPRKLEVVFIPMVHTMETSLDVLHV